MTDKKKRRATGHTEVKTYVPTSFDEVADGPSLVEIQLTETFSGDIEGEATVRVIQAVGKEMNADWFVVPGSGTGDLKGLRGDGGFKAQLGEHGSIWLDYYFE